MQPLSCCGSPSPISTTRINDAGHAAVALAEKHPYLAPTVEALHREQARAKLDERIAALKKVQIEKRTAQGEKRTEPWFRRWFRR